MTEFQQLMLFPTWKFIKGGQDETVSCSCFKDPGSLSERGEKAATPPPALLWRGGAKAGGVATCPNVDFSNNCQLDNVCLRNYWDSPVQNARLQPGAGWKAGLSTHWSRQASVGVGSSRKRGSRVRFLNSHSHWMQWDSLLCKHVGKRWLQPCLF